MLNFDDKALLLPMSHVQSFSDYFNLWNDNGILDVQPIRDLSYIIEFRLADVTGIKIHPQLVNLFLYLVALLLILKISRTQGFSNLESKFIATYLAVHPVAVNSVAWSSSRKHILSFLFISIATWLYLRWLSTGNKKFYAGAIFCYTLSCLSQPINVAWFLWAGLVAYLHEYDSNRSPSNFIKSLLSIAIYAVIGLTVAAVNLWYYSSSRYSDFLGVKFTEEGWNLIGNRLLIFGRFFTQLLFPLRPSITSYDPVSWFAVAGVVLFPLFLFILWKFKIQNRFLILWGIFSALPMLVVNGPSNQHYGWDTYLLTPLIGWAFIMGFTVKTIIKNQTLAYKPVLIFSMLILILFSIQTRRSADAWQNQESLWTRALETEPTPISIAGYVKLNLSNQKNIHEMWPLILSLHDSYPKNHELPYLLGRTIYEDKQIDLKTKTELFLKYDQKSPWFVYYRSAFDASQNRFSEADDRLTDLFSVDRKNAINNFGTMIGDIVGSWYAMCIFAKHEHCEDHVNMVKNSMPSSKWPDKLFTEKLSKFNLKFEDR
jgi:hypothetical protein